jgi:hypothetical protein
MEDDVADRIYKSTRRTVGTVDCESRLASQWMAQLLFRRS